MLMSKMCAEAGRFQFRDQPFSDRTVHAIVAEGIDLAKFDAIPVLAGEDGRYIVAGDGHSRWEAIRRLWEQQRLPIEWRQRRATKSKDNDYDIPTRIVTESEARTLSWTANLSRDDFSPTEQARVFRAMLDSKMSIEQVATAAHRSVSYIRSTLSLNVLCNDIRFAMTLTADAGGIDVHIAKLLAAKFEQYGIGAAQQQDLWHRALKHADLTAGFVRALLDRIGNGLAQTSGTQDMLFAIPANVASVMSDLRDRSQHLRRAERGLAWLVQCKDSGVLDDLPELKTLLDCRGKMMLDSVRNKTQEDADIIGRLCYAEV
jgi:hypothetical protein